MVTSDAEIETERLKEIADRKEDRGEDVLDNAEPGSFYAHEALYMAAFLEGSFYDQVLMAPTVLQDPEFYRLAHKIHESMYELYQAIGAKHLPIAGGDA